MSLFGPNDLLPRYAAELVKHGPAALAAAAVALVVTLPLVRRGLDRLPEIAGASRVRLCFLLATVAGGLCWAWQLVWASDDAYISFRYAANLLDGHGLVWNPGERVEGYTNFLWLMIVAPFIALGIDPGQAAVILNLVCFVGVLLLAARLERLLLWPDGAPEPARRTPPFAPLLAATCYPMACFATSALETIFIALMALLAVERALVGWTFVAGLAGIAGVMAHPDQAILYVALGAALLSTRPPLRVLLRYAAHFVFIYVPYFLIRWRYYGDPFPNTYYAKSANLANWPQGFTYVGIAFVTAGLWAATPAAVLGLRRTWSTLPGRYALIALPLYVLYIAKIGGDFMQGRLLVPVLPIWFVFAGVGIHGLFTRQRWKLAAALAVLAVPAALPVNIFGDGERLWDVTEERAYYPLLQFSPPVNRSPYQRQGQTLRTRFKDRGFEPRIALAGVGLVSFYSRLPITDILALNDRKTAHKPLAFRAGMMGHEKHAGAGRIIESGAVMSLFPVYPGPFDALTRLELDGFSYSFTRWDPTLLPALQAPPAGRFTDIVAHLRDTARTLTGPGHITPPAEELACLLWFADSYYLAHNDDAETRSALAAVAALDSNVRGAEALVFTGGERRAGAVRVKGFGFSPAEWASLERAGRAFAAAPLEEAPLGQQEIFGQQGHFANSFRLPHGDSATGTLRLPWTIQGDALTFRIGGGRDPEGVRVSLLVDGQRVASATGCTAELLGRRAWNVRPWKGRPAVVEIADTSSAPWGHLLADELEEWRLPESLP